MSDDANQLKRCPLCQTWYDSDKEHNCDDTAADDDDEYPF